MKELGAYPQASLAREERSDGTFGICTQLPKERYMAMGHQFQSNLFEQQCREFNVKRKEFCYGGDWVFELNFSTGLCHQCLSNTAYTFNFFENLDRELELKAVGCQCNMDYCTCVSLQAWGVMPEHSQEWTVLDLRDRPEARWVKGKVKNVFAHRLSETNQLYTEEEKKEAHLWNLQRQLLDQQYYMIKAKDREQEYEGLLSDVRNLLALTENGNHIWIMDLIVVYGKLLALFGEEPESDLGAFRKFYKKMKGNTSYLFYLAYLYMKNNNYRKARELFLLVQNNSENEEEKQASGDILKVLGEDRENER